MILCIFIRIQNQIYKIQETGLCIA